jgi:hypothetical protein
MDTESLWRDFFDGYEERCQRILADAIPYEVAGELCWLLSEYLAKLPGLDDAYLAWAWLTDACELGRTEAVSDHAEQLMRQAAADFRSLRRSGPDFATYGRQWRERVASDEGLSDQRNVWQGER